DTTPEPTCQPLIQVGNSSRSRTESAALPESRTMKSLVGMATEEGQKVSTPSAFFIGFIGLVFLIVGISFLATPKGISAAMQTNTPRASYGPASREGFPGPGFVRTFGVIFSIVGTATLSFAVYHLVG
ncbi:hypothetical protein ACWEPI_40875, partial [Streptomyces sp. NPDC004262]